MRDEVHLRALLVALAALLSTFACACAPAAQHAQSGASQRSIPPSSLVARAWAGREPQTTPRAAAVVWYAAWQVGKQYCWGGSGPACFDCSGLVQQAWGSVGVHVPRTADEIARELPEVPIDAVRAGDILWWPGHVGIYAGNGWVIDALGAKWGVVRRPAKDPWRAFRPHAEWTSDSLATAH
jgi:cell wall-associated NlpC family hydrolase